MEGNREMGSNGTIVVVDDEPFVLEATRRLLTSAGYEVHACEQWAGIAGLVRAVDPQLILLDFNMPALRGDNVCVILKKMLSDAGTRIVIHSSEPESDLIEIVERCGADGYICKNDHSRRYLDRIADEVELAQSSAVEN